MSRQTADRSRGGRELHLAKPVLGSSCLPVLLQEQGLTFPKSWRKHGESLVALIHGLFACTFSEMCQAVSAVMEECELQAVKSCSAGMNTRDHQFPDSSVLSRSCLDNSLHLHLSRRKPLCSHVTHLGFAGD